MAYEREDLQKIDDLAIEYYNEEDTSRKKVMKEKIAVLFMNNLEYIIHSGRLKKLHFDETKTEIIRSACLVSFVECLNKYNPKFDESGIIPFMAFFYRIAYWNTTKDLDEFDGYYCNDKEKENPFTLDGNDISDMYEVCDKSEGPVEYAETNQSVNEKLALFIGCILMFQQHNDMSKRSSQTKYKYYRSFYTGDMVYATRGEDFLHILMKYEQLIEKSCSTEFLDYIYKDKVRSLSEMALGNLKYYKELKNIKIFGETVLDYVIKVPIEQNVYATFFDVSKTTISDNWKLYEAYKNSLLDEKLGA